MNSDTDSRPSKPVPISSPARWKYAGIGVRAFALVIDHVILGILFSLLVMVFGRHFSSIVVYDNGYMWSGDMSVRSCVSPVVLGWLYYALFESSSQQATPGKAVCHLLVTDIEGKRISFLRASGRYFGKYVSAFILFIGYLMAAFTPHRQALHDILAGTLVWRRNAPPPRPQPAPDLQPQFPEKKD